MKLEQAARHLVALVRVAMRCNAAEYALKEAAQRIRDAAAPHLAEAPGEQMDDTLRDQIEQCKRSVEQWPQWMKDAAHTKCASMPAEAAGEQSAAPEPIELDGPIEPMPEDGRVTVAATPTESRPTGAGPSAGDGMQRHGVTCAILKDPDCFCDCHLSDHLPVRELQAEPVAWLDFASGAPARFETNDRHPIFTEAATRPFDELRIALYAAQERPPAERAQVPRYDPDWSVELEQMSPGQRRAHDKALAALDTMAALWAARVGLPGIAASIACLPDERRSFGIVAMVEQAFVEGAYQHFIDHEDGKTPCVWRDDAAAGATA